MRAQMTITDLDEGRWEYLQRNVRAEYEIPEGTTRVCLTFIREDEERHVEMPLTTLIGLLAGLVASSATKGLQGFLTKIREAKATEVKDDGNTRPAPYGFDSDGSVVALDQDGNP